MAPTEPPTPHSADGGSDSVPDASAASLLPLPILQRSVGRSLPAPATRRKVPSRPSRLVAHSSRGRTRSPTNQPPCPAGRLESRVPSSKGDLRNQLAGPCVRSIPKRRRSSSMDGLWFEYQNGSEDNMCPESNPFPDNTNTPRQAPDLEEVTPIEFNSRAPVPRKGGPKRIPTGRKLANFTVEEDRVLLSSWLNVTTDPIVGTGQRAESYWKRIFDGYNAHRGSHPERTQKSLNKRWDSIKENVSLFSGFYQQVLNRNQSGTTNSDKTLEAIILFSSIVERPFTMIHCWDILKNEVKWLDLQNKAKQVDGRGGKDDAEQFLAFDDKGSNSLQVDGACSSPSSALGKRPIGRDKAKESRKRCSSSSQSQQSSSEFVSSMHDLHLQTMTFMKDNRTAKEQKMHTMLAIEERKVAAKEFMMQVEAKRIAMERERLVLMQEEQQLEQEKQRKIEDERILAIDLDKCNSMQKTYYKAMQEAIIARLEDGRGLV